MVKSIRILILFISGLFYPAVANAGRIVDFADNSNYYVAESYILIDSLGKYTIEDVVDIPNGSMLNFLQNDYIRENITYWVKIRVTNNTLLNQVMLEIRPRFRTAELFYFDDEGAIVKQKMGLDYEYSKWNLKYKNYLFQLPTKQGGENWYYLKIKSDYNTGYGLTLASYPNLINRILPENFFNGLFYGIVAIATLFSLIFFLKLKEFTYLFYALYVLCFGLFALVDWGIIVQYLTYIPLQWHPDLYTIPFALMTIFLLLYSRELLETRKKALLFDKLITAAIIARTLVYLTGTILNIQELSNPSIDNILLFSAYLAAIHRLKQGYKPARYFLIGLSVLYIGLIVHSLENIGLVPYNVLPSFSMYKTGVLEMFFFSLALADRFRMLKLEQDKAHRQTITFLQENSELKDRMIVQLNENEKLKDELNRKLEVKVKERTRELEEANNVILEINRFLEESNRKLAGDVKKISLNRVMQKTVTFDEFREIYPDDESCHKFLERLKWSSGFACKKCGHKRYSAGNTIYSRRCSRCNYIERITSGTIFSHVKFPISKAFYMLFLLNTGKSLTIDEIAEILDMRKQTVWYFRKKIETVMKNAPKKRGNLDEGWSRWILVREKSGSNK